MFWISQAVPTWEVPLTTKNLLSDLCSGSLGILSDPSGDDRINAKVSKTYWKHLCIAAETEKMHVNSLRAPDRQANQVTEIDLGL